MTDWGIPYGTVLVLGQLSQKYQFCPGVDSVLAKAYFRLKVTCSGKDSKSGPNLTVVSTELEGSIQEVRVRTDGVAM